MLSESVDGVYKFTWWEPRQSGLGDDLESTKRSDTSLTNLQVCICEHRWLLTRDRVTESSPKWHFRTLFGLMETSDNTEVFTDFSHSLDSGFFSATKQTKGQTMATKGPLTILFSEIDHEVAKIWLCGSLGCFIFYWTDFGTMIKSRKSTFYYLTTVVEFACSFAAWSD